MTRKQQENLKGRLEARGRSGSQGNLEEIWKRKREESRGRIGKKDVFKNSKKAVRSPDAEKMGEEMKEMLRKLMREELGDVMKVIKEVKG